MQRSLHTQAFSRSASWFATMAAAALSTQCAAQTQLVIEVASDIAPETDLQSVTIRVARLDAMGQPLPIPITEQTVQIGQTATGGKRTIPLSLGVFAARADDSRRVLVTVNGRRMGGVQAQTSAVVAFFPNRTARYTLYLAGLCTPEVNTACEAQGQACGMMGICVDRIRSSAEVLTNGEFRDVMVPPGGGPVSDVPGGDANADGMVQDVPTMDASDALVPPDGDRPPDPTIPIPRLIAPMSTSMVSSHQVTLKWELTGSATGARVKICRNRPRGDRCLAPVDAVGTMTTVTIPAGEWGWFYWSVAGTSPTGVGNRSDIVWQFWVRPQDASAHTDTIFPPPVNFNGDRYADFAIGAPSANMTGTVTVRYGTMTNVWSPQVIAGSTPNENFGGVVAGVGDLNGDGFTELAVVSTTAGGVSIFAGGPGGLPPAPSAFIPGLPGRRFVASAGDVDGDGFGDLIVGSPDESPLMAQTGVVRIYRGAAMLPRNLVVAASVNGLAPGDQFGASVSGGGDLNGDGYGDVIVGAPTADPMGRSNAGTVSVCHGSDMGSITPQPVVVQGASVDDLFGNSLSIVGDLDGDRLADLVVGAPSVTGTGSVSVYRGGSMALQRPTVLTKPAVSLFGVTLAGAGDVNNDGLADLVVASGAVIAAGSVTVYRSTGVGYQHQAEFTAELMGATAANQFGFSVAGADDVDGDGFSEVLVGAPMIGPGRALIYRGSGMGTEAAMWRTIDGAAPNDLSGFSVAQWQRRSLTGMHWLARTATRRSL